MQIFPGSLKRSEHFSFDLRQIQHRFNCALCVPYNQASLVHYLSRFLGLLSHEVGVARFLIPYT